ncbi:MAG: tRNA pseudouridine(38-40) synthase TruA [Leptospiraceae bacterium]|nr:tRNA pseudouridine(38-40) synthase TruA [Leptospiraceae bacterium]MDW7976314.1 tRNA pseudouridine(38-40) synthase TruA [Leptospiraceae bacterium]
MKYALTIAYDGTKFVGMQIQKDDITVQGKIEEALKILFRYEERIAMAGRTDSGVHATGQVISFRAPGEIHHLEKFISSFHALAGPHISVIDVHQVPNNFHARFDCIAREYEYLIYCGKKNPIFLENKVWHIYEEINLFEIQKEAEALIGEHDFKAFSKKSSEVTIRYLEYIKIQQIEEPFLGLSLYSIRFRGNAFLHNMVRIIVGSMVDRILGKLPYSLKEILDSKDRTKAGRTAPAEGLYFRSAYYPDVPELKNSGLKLLKNYPVFGSSYYKGTMKVTE